MYEDEEDEDEAVKIASLEEVVLLEDGFELLPSRPSLRRAKRTRCYRVSKPPQQVDPRSAAKTTRFSSTAKETCERQGKRTEAVGGLDEFREESKGKHGAHQDQDAKDEEEEIEFIIFFEGRGNKRRWKKKRQRKSLLKRWRGDSDGAGVVWTRKKEQMRELVEKGRKHIRFGKEDGDDEEEEEDDDGEEEEGADAGRSLHKRALIRAKGKEPAQESLDELAAVEVDVERPANIKFSAVYLMIGMLGPTKGGTANGRTASKWNNISRQRPAQKQADTERNSIAENALHRKNQRQRRRASAGAVVGDKAKNPKPGKAKSGGDGDEGRLRRVRLRDLSDQEKEGGVGRERENDDQDDDDCDDDDDDENEDQIKRKRRE
ncbi:hypothetical protein BJ742DRAFT_743372 [Cladochytrium replicatum]|nr:hypothetical protein BJ742DRAFT_743372 [Cladochytrium replicatum]